MLRNYEIVLMIYFNKIIYIDDVIKYYSDIINSCGKINKIENLGLKYLAYSIKKNNRANYIVMNVYIDSRKVNDISNDLKFNNKILRFLIIKLSKK